MEEEKNQFLKQYEELEEIRKSILTEDERIILKLKLEDKTDAQIAAVLGVTTTAVNQKRRHLYKLIESLVWWKNNEDRILRDMSTHLSAQAVIVLNAIALRKRQKEIAKMAGISVWALHKIIPTIYEVYSKEDAFRAFIENLRLGYKLPWRIAFEPPVSIEPVEPPQTGSEPAVEPPQTGSEPPSEPPKVVPEPPVQVPTPEGQVS